MRIALAQMNTIVGDLKGNRHKLIKLAKQAKQKGAELVIFPELTLCSYPPLDLLLMPWFIDANLKAIDSLCELSKEIALIVGYVDRKEESEGRGLYNAAALLADGKIMARRYKTLLPTYGVFDEDRYFDPAKDNLPVVFRGKRLGITICEDIWNDRLFWSKRRYERDPVEELATQGIDLLINISASPFWLNKRTLREEMLKAVARRYEVPLILVNFVGGNDELIFDGASAAYDAQGECRARARDFEDDLLMFDSETQQGELHETTTEEMERLEKALVLGLRDYMHKCGFEKVVLGLSGGIDSAMVAVLAARALGKQNVTGVAMPSCFSSSESLKDAQELACRLGISLLVLPIDQIYEQFLENLKETFKDREFDIAEENIQARIRGNLLMALSNKFGWLVLGTGNKSELSVGYCTLYGDMVGGLAVLGDVPKTMVYRLAQWLNRDTEIIPRSILEKPPSAELRPDQLDTDSLPPYETLDPLLRHYIEEHQGPKEMIAQGADPELAHRVMRMVNANEYKRRQAPPVLKVTSRAFGRGWRMPLAKRITLDE